jgi:hypothetical protein
MWIILVFYLSPLDYDRFNIIISKKGYECKLGRTVLDT